MAPAVALPVPAGRKVKPILLTHSGPAPTTPLSLVDEHTKSEEFDFADVFGPAPGEGTSTAHWLFGDPEVICSRSHSLVGPSPRPSFVRQRSSRRGGEEHTHEFERVERKSILSRSSQSADQPASASEQQQLAESEFQDARGLLSDSGSDVGEEQEGGDVSAKQLSDTEERLGPQDFERLRVVGQGAFGKVFQVQKKRTTEIYAMKVMRKDKIMQRNHGDYMKAERDILTKIVHPFIVQLRYSFQVCLAT